MCVCAHVSVNYQGYTLTVLLPRCFSCLVITIDNNLGAILANWAKPLRCTTGAGRLSTHVSSRAGGLCWSAIYWNAVLPSPARPELAFTIALAKLVQGKKMTVQMKSYFWQAGLYKCVSLKLYWLYQFVYANAFVISLF